jgi:hypothetical protein
MGRDLVEHAGRVPQVPRVELDPDRGRADLVDELDGVGERVHDRPVLDPLALERLERDPQPQPRRLGRDLAQAVDDRRAVARPRQADDPARAERREPVERAEDGVDAFARVVRPGKERQRVDRRDLGDGARRAEPAVPESLE